MSDAIAALATDRSALTDRLSVLAGDPVIAACQLIASLHVVGEMHVAGYDQSRHRKMMRGYQESGSHGVGFQTCEAMDQWYF